jgi:hypothetical protein
VGRKDAQGKKHSTTCRGKLKEEEEVAGLILFLRRRESYGF